MFEESISEKESKNVNSCKSKCCGSNKQAAKPGECCTTGSKTCKCKH